MALVRNPIYITYIEKQGPFIKIWGQPDRNMPLIVKKSLLQLADQFDQANTVPALDNIYIGNVLYCAKYIDGVYYRVQITNLLLQQNLVEVLFIDFGNREVLSALNLRIIPERIASGLLSIPPQAKDFILANVTHRGSDWDAATFSLISNEIRFTELTYTVVSQLGNSILIKLYRNMTEDFALSLFNRGIVLSIALNAQHMILQNTTSSIIAPTVTPVSVIERQASLGAVNTNVVTPVPQPSTPTFVTYKGVMIEPGTEYRVYVSYVSDGPCQFSIQLQKSEDNLARLMKELNTMALQPLEEFPMPGTVCVARCVEDDHICRAVVTNMVDSQYKVFYVDFGNTEVVPIDNLFQIPFKYVIPKVMATRYALAGLDKSNVTTKMKCAFKEFVCDKLLRMQAMQAPARSALPLCNLYDENNVNVLDVLLRVASLAYPETIQLTRGFSQEVHVSYVHSCNRFYVQIKGKEEELTILMNNLQTVCANAEPLQTLRVGLPCCALFEDDGQWYRAQVINIEGANIKVRYIDYGNEAVVANDSLVEPPGEVVTGLRPQAVECCLNGYQKMEDDLERDNILEQLILEKDFTMKVIEVQNKRALVDLIDASRYNVGSLLLEQLAASKSQFSPILIQENHQIEQRKMPLEESTNFNRNERKPLRNQNERVFERQESWRQPKPPRNDDEFDKPNKDSFEKSWRENLNKADAFDKPHKDSFDKPRKDNFEKRDGFKKESWTEEESNFNRKPNYRAGFKKDVESPEDTNGNWKSNQRDNFKKDSQNDDNSRSNRDGFRRETRDSKPNDDGGWDHSERKGSVNDRFKKFSDDNRKPRDRKPYSGDKKSSWESTDTAKTPELHGVTDPAPFTAIFTLPDLLNRNEKVTVSWFHDPAHFFCQLFDSQAEFKTMMEDLQLHYCNIKPESAPVGSSVIALFPDDSVLYRARILEVLGSQYRVQYIDFGNVSLTDKVWPVENKFMKLPAQAICCGFNGICPIEESWPNSAEFSSYFNNDYYYCQFISCDIEKYVVELTSDSGISISDSLVNAGLAQYLVESTYDPSVLLGQQIKVTLRDVQALDVFSLELPNGTWILCTMHNLADATETFENTLKQSNDNFVIMYVDNVFEDKVEVTLYDTTGTKLKILEPDEGAFETVDLPSPLPILYSTINGYVSHIETLEDKAQVTYIQLAEYVDALGILLQNLFNCYDGVVCEEPIEPEVNIMYAVHSADTNWYRGIVKSIDGESVTVNFIDYGNSETVDKGELRNLAAEFLEQHILAIEVSAPGVDETFIDQNVTGTIWYAENGWVAELQIQSIEEQLAEQPSEQPADIPTTMQPEGEVHINEQTSEPPSQEDVLLPNTVEDQPIQQIGVLVIISHTDSPNEFYLQQYDSLETIDNLQASLQEQVADFPVLENPAAGILCAAPYSIDQQWYRAQILDADEDITTVRFVDYGNTDVISNDTTSVKTLPPELLSLEQYARRSSLMLEPNGSEWSTAALERFEQLTNVDTVTVEIIHQDEKSTYVQLYANGLDVADALIQEGLANKLQLETESSCTGYVSNLNSPSEFWIQLENSVADLEWIAEQLSSASSFPELEDSTPGSLCAALFPEDEMWYRARILSNTVAGIEVLFIDYGNSCTCISLRQLPEDLIMLQPLAQKCCLEKPTGILQWGQQANEEFKTVSADGATVFNIDKISTGETCIVKLLLNGEDISIKLLPVTEDAYISYFESVTSFWIQKLNDSTKLDLITETMTAANEWPQYIESQESCEFVAALNTEDETWYRAHIISKNDSGREVFFIDYGNVGNASDIRLLSCDMDKEPPLAVKCKLEPLPGFRWSEESTNTLAEINNEGTTLFQVEFVGGDVVRLYLDGSDIRSKLESITVSSAQNSPKKSISLKSCEPIEAAEYVLNKIEKSVSEEIIHTSSIVSTDDTNYSSIEDSGNKNIDFIKSSSYLPEKQDNINDTISINKTNKNQSIVANTESDIGNSSGMYNEDTLNSELSGESNLKKSHEVVEINCTTNSDTTDEVDETKHLNATKEDNIIPAEKIVETAELNFNSDINSQTFNGDDFDIKTSKSNIENLDCNTNNNETKQLNDVQNNLHGAKENETELNKQQDSNLGDELVIKTSKSSIENFDCNTNNNETKHLNNVQNNLHDAYAKENETELNKEQDSNLGDELDITSKSSVENLDCNTNNNETKHNDVKNNLHDAKENVTEHNKEPDSNLDDLPSSRSSLPYTEKIVPGSISRGDLTTTDTESTTEGKD